MAGCYGSHPLDRWREQQLDDYLNSFEDGREPSEKELEAKDTEIRQEIEERKRDAYYYHQELLNENDF